MSDNSQKIQPALGWAKHPKSWSKYTAITRKEHKLIVEVGESQPMVEIHQDVILVFYADFYKCRKR